MKICRKCFNSGALSMKAFSLNINDDLYQHSKMHSFNATTFDNFQSEYHVRCADFFEPPLGVPTF